ncbi:MAG: energy-coupling factor transporter ATPase [Clostridiales bacterium]|nr:energy-coupling factor transporter ATPase [Clostridiales bacterium]
MSDVHLKLQNLSFTYDEGDGPAVDDISLDIKKGEFVALLGHNGSGKSTVAKLLNGLYTPTSGKVFVSGMDTSDEELTWEIRKRCGMVFQNPDNQIVATMVREDVAFGLENIGIPTLEMPAIIDEALKAVNMSEFAQRAPHLLSGGQKQRVAIAGVLAMQPEAIVLDEATAMLDPSGRKEVLETALRLNRERGVTVLWITHFMEEAAKAGRVVVMHKGKLVMDGTPKEVFSQVETIRGYRLDVPPMAQLSQMLKQRGVAIRQDILTTREMLAEVLTIAHQA